MITWMTRVALEIVGQSGLGTSFSPVTEEHPEHSFVAAVKELGSVSSGILLLSSLREADLCSIDP
jgi:hypothetical protein